MKLFTVFSIKVLPSAIFYFRLNVFDFFILLLFTVSAQGSGAQPIASCSPIYSNHFSPQTIWAAHRKDLCEKWRFPFSNYNAHAWNCKTNHPVFYSSIQLHLISAFSEYHTIRTYVLKYQNNLFFFQQNELTKIEKYEGTFYNDSFLRKNYWIHTIPKTILLFSKENPSTTLIGFQSVTYL